MATDRATTDEEAARQYLGTRYPRASEPVVTHTYKDGSKLYSAALGPVFAGGHSRYVSVRVHPDGTISSVPTRAAPSVSHTSAGRQGPSASGMNVYTAGLCWRHWQGMTKAEKEAHLARRNKR